MASVCSEHVNFVAACSQFLGDVLAEDLHPADHRRVVRHEVSNVQGV